MSGFKPTLILLAVVSVATSIVITVTFGDNIYLCWYERERIVYLNTGQDPEDKFCPYQYAGSSLSL